MSKEQTLTERIEKLEKKVKHLGNCIALMVGLDNLKDEIEKVRRQQIKFRGR